MRLGRSPDRETEADARADARAEAIGMACEEAIATIGDEVDDDDAASEVVDLVPGATLDEARAAVRYVRHGVAP